MDFRGKIEYSIKPPRDSAMGSRDIIRAFWPFDRFVNRLLISISRAGFTNSVTTFTEVFSDFGLF